MKKIKFFSITSLVAISLFLSSCSNEEVSSELQEVETLNEVEAKVQGVIASRVLPYINGTGNQAVVSVIVEGNDLVLEARRDLFGGGNRETFGFFNIVVNGQNVRLRNFRPSKFQEGRQGVTRWTFRNVPGGVSSFSGDFRYRLINRFRPSSRPTIVAVSSTSFSLSTE